MTFFIIIQSNNGKKFEGRTKVKFIFKQKRKQ